MKSSMKHWKRLVLLAMLAWVLLFLALFTYFMESRVSEPRSPAAAASHGDVRLLAAVQGRHRVIMGSWPEGIAASPRPEGAHRGEADGHYNQERATWSTMPQQSEEEGEEEEEEEEEEEQQGATRPDSHGLGERWAEPDDLEEYYFSKSKFVIRRLWKGSVSASMLTPRLQKAMRDYVSANKHRVSFRGRRRARLSAPELLCQLKQQVQLRVLDGTEQPFSRLGWDTLVPPLPLEQLYGSKFHSCAVVTSAGAILNSSLGKEIDSHDAVLRFNAAPTEGYESDVGNKTTIRIINSQILANPKHQFNTSALYRDVTLVAWDPAPYAVNLLKWYRSPDYDLFTPYVAHRKKNPNQPFYILHPKFIWQLWDIIQGNTQENIQPNPPSSGFIGVLLMMALCEEVHVYEYIPSLRQTDLCHYHEQYYDAACTLGAYHPLLYEKMLVQRMNRGSEHDLQKKGRVTLPGLSTLRCDP